MTTVPPQPWMVSDESHRVMAALGEARFVGGCVRDALLGVPPGDIDIATPHPPDAVIRRLEAAGLRAVPTGLAHGTVTAVIGAARFEITTLRRDVACFGRHAQVAFTDDWQADAARRDFTINAMSCDMAGTLFDPFGGVEDLVAGRVRFIGSAEARIREDVLRLLRFFRFFGRYGRTPPDAEALAACRNLAPLLPTLSGERVRTELFRLLTGARCLEVWDLLASAAILPHLLPEATRQPRLEALVGLETALGLEGEARAVPRLAALLDTGRAGALAVAARLRLSRSERDRLIALGTPSVAITVGDEAPILRRAAVGLGDAALLNDLALLAAAAGGGGIDWVSSVRDVAARWTAARFPLSGADVVGLGVPAGPAVGRALGDVELWWADRDFEPDHAACLADAARRIP